MRVAALAVALQLVTVGLVAGVASADDTVPQAKLTASDPAGSDLFGSTVAISGDTAVVGAAGATGGAFQGAAYVFSRNGTGGWTERQKLVASDGQANDTFGNALAIDGDTLLIGARGRDGGHGAVYVFTRSGDVWVEQAILTGIRGMGQPESFGATIALDGDTAVIGAPFADRGEPFDQGAAYVFTRSGDTWGSVVKLTRPELGFFDTFGWSVALVGDRLLVGAPFAEAGGEFSQGAAYEYEREGGIWREGQVLQASDGGLGDLFGTSISLENGLAAVGASQASAGGVADTGAAYVFAETIGGWQEQAKLTASDAAPSDNFGFDVALSGNRVVVGANFASIGFNPGQGAAYVFVQTGAAWDEKVKLVAADGAAGDEFGQRVAIAGPTVISGSFRSDLGTGQDQGAAYIYELP
jgi:FG-GAP repeat